MRVNKKELILAINHLQRAFLWEESEEGHDYWSEVHTKLENYL